MAVFMKTTLIWRTKYVKLLTISNNIPNVVPLFHSDIPDGCEGENTDDYARKGIHQRNWYGIRKDGVIEFVVTREGDHRAEGKS